VEGFHEDAPVQDERISHCQNLFVIIGYMELVKNSSVYYWFSGMCKLTCTGAVSK
jgi:hypothetical protein